MSGGLGRDTTHAGLDKQERHRPQRAPGNSRRPRLSTPNPNHAAADNTAETRVAARRRPSRGDGLVVRIPT